MKTKKFKVPIEYTDDFSDNVGDNILVSKAYVLEQITNVNSGTSGSATEMIDSFPMGVSSSTTITIGAKGRYPISYSGTITGWVLVSDFPCNLTLDVWKANNTIPTDLNSIFTTKPSLSSQEINSETNLNIAVASGDIFILEIESNDLAKYVRIDLQIRK